MNMAEKVFIPPRKIGVKSLPLALADLRAFDTIIDVRSPAEFAEDHVPGAVNFPVLSDAERAHVGTLHKQSSAFDAKKVGAALVARNIAHHLETALKDRPRDWKPLIYCWRGGSRSGAMAHILRSVGWPAVQMEHGYKAWRGQVIHDLETLPTAFTYRVVCGRTGSGKSRLLDALAAEGRQVLDLERLAAHKGSVLGDLPAEPQPSQKLFDSRLWTALSGFEPARIVYIEAESKKVGVLRVPEKLMTLMRASDCVEVATPHPLRVKLLREEYAHLITDKKLLFSKLDCLTDLHSSVRIDVWKSLANDGLWDLFVENMLVHHYDPAYGRSMFRNYTGVNRAKALEVTDISEAGFRRVAQQLPDFV
jgi:tRNA 2-selenouridine synthase